MQVYPAKYTDKNGEVETIIRNDGKTLRMNVDDVEFFGSSFDDFEPEVDISSERLKSFSLNKFNCLYGCRIKCEIPIQLIFNNSELPALLLVTVDLMENIANDGIDYGLVHLKLKHKDFEFNSKGKSGWFEDELIDIQKQLPNGYKFKNCFGCAFSDYSVYGHGFFGDMLCYKNRKDEYRKVFSKADFMKIMGFSERVQETYFCSEFEIRKANTGYRG